MKERLEEFIGRKVNKYYITINNHDRVVTMNIHLQPVATAEIIDLSFKILRSDEEKTDNGE